MHGPLAARLTRREHTVRVADLLTVGLDGRPAAGGPRAMRQMLRTSAEQTCKCGDTAQ